MAIGKIKDRGIRNEFCRNFDLVDLEPALEDSKNKYSRRFGKQ